MGKKRPAFKVLIAFAGGIVAASFIELQLGLTYLVAAGLFLAALASALSRRSGGHSMAAWLSQGALALLGFVLFKTHVGYFPPSHISTFTDLDSRVLVRGVISRYPETRRAHVHLTLETNAITVGDSTVQTSGAILLRVAGKTAAFRYGDEISVTGFLRQARDRRNPGEFDYRNFLLAQGISGIMSVREQSRIRCLSSGHGSWFMREMVVPTKSYLSQYIAHALPEQQAALLQGLLLGERGEIDVEVKESFAKLGVIHVLAVSGLHVGFVVLIVVGTLGMLRVPYRARVTLALLALLFYAFLTNLKPPVVRASIMTSIVLGGSLLQRRTDFVNSLALAAFVILVANPMELFQAGFQLSFAAVIAIVFLHPRLRQLVICRKMYAKASRVPAATYFLDLLLVSVAAFIGTMPFTITYFHRLPLTSLLANLFVVPLAFLALAGGMTAGLFNLFSPVLADNYMAFSGLCLSGILASAEFGARFPFGSLEVYGSGWLLWFAFIIVVLVFFKWQNLRVRRFAPMALLLLLNLWVWSSNFSARPLRVAFLDVGQGDAILLSLPEGQHLLIDAGSRSPYFDNGRAVVAPYLKREGIKKLKAVVLSHGDSDHLGGVPYVLRNFEVDEVWDNGRLKDTAVFREYLSLIDSLGINHRRLAAGDFIGDFFPVQIYVLHPTESFRDDAAHSANEASLSLRVSYGDIDFLFAGDVENDGEGKIAQLQELVESEVLKVNHHGSKTSSGAKFLSAVKPEHAVISVGRFNRFRHPAPEVIRRLESTGAKIYRTDRDAALLFETNGKEVRRLRWK